MKKILILLFSLALLLTGCGSTNVENKDTQITANKSIQESKEIKLDEPFQVKTKSGDYNFTIKSATKTDWWKRANNNEDKTVILLNLECENISFKNENHNGVLLYDAFTLKDNNNYMLSNFSMGYDDVNLGYNEIPPNTKCKLSIPYVIENNAASVIVEFVHGGRIENIPITE